MTSQNEWHIERDQWKGSYAHKDTEWIAYDDRELVRNKAFYVREQNLLGVALYPLFADDRHNNCGQGNYPKLTEIHSVLQFPRKFVASATTSSPLLIPMHPGSTSPTPTQPGSMTIGANETGFIDVIAFYPFLSCGVTLSFCVSFKF